MKMELLKNNHQDMNTVVETFLIEETLELIYDNEQLESWNKMVDELGLTGQTKIVKKDKSPIPFLHMKSTLVKTCETLCPRKVDVKEYSATPIPVEILSLVSLSTNEKHFDLIQIWYDEKSPDPFCIGLIYDNDEYRQKKYTWSMQKYLIGKWGDVKRSFEELTEMARNRYVKEKTVEYNQMVKDYQRKLEDLEREANREFGDNSSADNYSLPF